MNNEIEQKAYYSTLFAYYKNLFTEKQQNIFISYYDEDFSLAEIAEDLNISRNAVWDTLKKVTAQLDDYEQKLNLYQKDNKLNKYLDELNNHTDEQGKKIIQEIQEME